VKNLIPHLLALAMVACAGAQGPEELVRGRDLCAWCRMPVSDLHFAAQIIVPGELPRFFDDPGCFAEFVKSGRVRQSDAVAWVADHRTGTWVRADRAVYTRVPGLTTPMNHQLVAHESNASRDADPAAKGGQPVPLPEIFGPQGPPGGAAS
jgi:copper chaperone NosL